MITTLTLDLRSTVEVTLTTKLTLAEFRQLAGQSKSLQQKWTDDSNHQMAISAAGLYLGSTVELAEHAAIDAENRIFSSFDHQLPALPSH